MQPSARLKCVAAFLLMVSVPSFFIGLVSYVKARNLLKKDALERLSLIAASKEYELLNFLNDKKEKAADFSSDGFIRDQLEKLRLSNDTDLEKDAIALSEHLKNNKMPLDKDLAELHVYDLQGRLVGGANEKDIGEHKDFAKDTEQLFFKRAVEGRVYIQNTATVHGKAMLIVSAPIKNRTNGETIGVLLNGYGIESVKLILAGRPRGLLGVSPRTRMLDLSKTIYLTDFGSNVLASVGKKPTSNYLDKEIMLKCLGVGEEVTRESVDPAGRHVLVASLCPRIEKDWKWILVVEEDRNYALEPLNSFGKILLAAWLMAMAFCVLLAWVVVHFVFKKIEPNSVSTIKLFGKKMGN